MAIRSIWAEDYSTSDQQLNENTQESLYAMHEQLMDMASIKLVFDTESRLWGWESVNVALKGLRSDIKFPTRTIAILDATGKILSANKYNGESTSTKQAG